MVKKLLPVPEDTYETEQFKQAAADVLYQYSRFAMVCIGEGVRPSDLRLHLMKEISGMPTTLKKASISPATSPKKASTSAVASPSCIGEPSSSGVNMNEDS